MASFKFYAIQSDNEDEVRFLLGLTSVLQIDFHEDAEIFIQSSANIDHLTRLFNWNKKPETGSRSIRPEEVFINFTGQSPPAGTSTSILSSEFKSDSDAKYVPKHLLHSQHASAEVAISLSWVVAKLIHEDNFSTSSPTRKLALVYTNEVKEWISLIEANEALIAKWYRQRDHETELSLIDVTRGVQADLVGKTAFACDAVIITKISLSTTQFIKAVRSINPDIRLIIHAFESPSVYFVNTHLHHLKDYLYENDLWLVSCKADEELSRYSWKKINTAVFPLKSPDLFLNTKVTSKLRHVFYLGRISEQKDLHEAIIAVSLIANEMRKENRKFKIIGYEDFLGLPHHRIPSLGYLEMLYKLVQKLGVSDLVEFHPAIPQNKIDGYLEEGIFLSTSFHSDENFGLVAYRALNLGIPVLLSDWGGHRDFVTAFTEVEFIPVYQYSRTPHINPIELSKKLLEIWSGKAPEKKVVTWKKVMIPDGNSRALLEPTALKVEIEKKVENSYPWAQRRWPLYGKIFSSFDDENYRIANLVYGAKKLPRRPSPEGTILSPFVKITEVEIKIVDCTTGVLRYSRMDQSGNIPLKQLGTDKEFFLSLPEWTWIWENGHIYAKGEP